MSDKPNQPEYMQASYPIPTHESWAIIDSTKLQQYKDCPRKFFYEYLLGLRPDNGNIHLNFGKLFHKAMEVLERGRRSDEALLKACEVASNLFDEYFGRMAALEPERFKGKTLTNAIKALEQYRREFADDRMEPLIIELGDSVLLDDSPERRLYYKLDMLLYDHNLEKVVVKDYKTAGGHLEGVWADQFLLRMQFGTYLHVAHCVYPPEQVHGCYIDGIAFQKTQIKMKRVVVRRSMGSMQNWWINTLEWFKRMEQDFERLTHATPSDPAMDAFPMNESNCTSYNTLCPFHSLCTSRHNPLQYDPEKVPVGYKREFWDPTKEGEE